MLVGILCVTLTLYTANYFLELSAQVLSRYLFYTTFALHLSVVAALVDLGQKRFGGLWAGLFLVTAAVAGFGQIKIAYQYPYGLAKDLWRGEEIGHHWTKNKFRELAQIPGPDAFGEMTMMSPVDWSYRVSALTDYRVVGVMMRAVSLPRFDERLEDVDRFFMPDTPSRMRDAILSKWEVDRILIPKEDGGSPVIMPSPAWEIVADAERFLLLAVPRSAGAGAPATPGERPPAGLPTSAADRDARAPRP